MSPQKRFLNLFAYTGTASVYAIKGGAAKCRSVDSSNTYLAWMEANFRRNGINIDRHPRIRGDVMEWLRVDDDKYDLVFCDPPTHSVSTDRRTFNVQADHVDLLRAIHRVLKPGGSVVFSNNFRKFKLSESDLSKIYQIKEITQKTIPRDFQRTMSIHRCWLLNSFDAE